MSLGPENSERLHCAQAGEPAHLSFLGTFYKNGHSTVPKICCKDAASDSL